MHNKTPLPFGGGVLVYFIFCLLHFGNQFVEDGWVILGEHREDLAVEVDVLFFQSIHESAVRESVRANRGIDADLPQAAEGAFLGAAISEGHRTGLEDRGASESDFGFAAPHHPLRLLEKIPAAFDVLGTALNAWHRFRDDASVV